MDFELSLEYLNKPVTSMGVVETKHEESFPEPVVVEDPNEEFKFDKKQKKVINRLVTAEDIKSDLADLKFSDDDETIVPPKPKRNRNRNKKKDPKVEETQEKVPKPESQEVNKDVSQPEKLSRRQKEKLRKQRKEERLKQAEKKRQEAEGEQITSKPKDSSGSKVTKGSEVIPTETPNKAPVNTPVNVIEKEKSPFERSSSPEDPFSVKLKSVKVVHSNKKYTERLPKIPPIETIMGLSNDQIYKLSSNDIKLKRIVSQAGKLLGNIIDFAMKNEELFLDEDVRTQFSVLCTNIAIHESRGLNKTLKVYPNIIETFSKYDELTLDHTNTKFTKSDKEIHQNNFDYSVLSYVGNIIIWLNSIHDLKLSKKQIKGGFGGYHLWDQLFKEESINMKRWKHVIKFREEFPFQPNQFIVVMKFLHIEIS